MNRPFTSVMSMTRSARSSTPSSAARESLSQKVVISSLLASATSCAASVLSEGFRAHRGGRELSQRFSCFQKQGQMVMSSLFACAASGSVWQSLAACRARDSAAISGSQQPLKQDRVVPAQDGSLYAREWPAEHKCGCRRLPGVTFFCLAPWLMESFSLKMGTVPILSRSSTVSHRLCLNSLSLKSLQVTSTCTPTGMRHSVPLSTQQLGCFLVGPATLA